MADATFTISAFGDEIADDLDEQLRVMNELNIGHLELRAAWGVNVLKMSDADVARARASLAAHNVQVSALGSPVGKSPLLDPVEKEVANLQRLGQIAQKLGTRNIRIFSFYPPDTSSNAHYDQHVDQAIASLARLVEEAEKLDLLLLLENEREIVGDTVARCHRILQALDSPSLTFAWDPANFVLVDEARVTEDGWPLLGPRTGYVHVKDAKLGGPVKAAGEGDGQVAELLTRLNAAGYQGILALEPHLAMAGHSSGFSGPEGMAYAVKKLREVMAATGCVETP
ncbi:MAG: TIM barrel protein [Caldilineaceae bacterium]